MILFSTFYFPNLQKNPVGSSERRDKNVEKEKPFTGFWTNPTPFAAQSDVFLLLSLNNDQLFYFFYMCDVETEIKLFICSFFGYDHSFLVSRALIILP